MMKKALKTLAVAVGMTGSVAFAAVSSLFFPGTNLLSDNSAEKLVNANGSTCSTGGDCTVDAGDRLIGVFTIETLEDPINGGATRFLSGSGSELTGYFDVTVTSVTNIGGQYLFTFAATDASGIAVSMYEDTTPDYQRINNTLASAVTSATDGSLWATFSVNHWFATAISNNIATIGAVTLPFNGGTFNTGLNMVTNNTGMTFGTVNCLDLNNTIVQVSACGSGSLLGTQGATTAFDSFDNVDFTMNRLPVPGVVALFGLGLLGMGLRRRT